jgi:hypothetical protein
MNGRGLLQGGSGEVDGDGDAIFMSTFLILPELGVRRYVGPPQNRSFPTGRARRREATGVDALFIYGQLGRVRCELDGTHPGRVSPRM